MSEGGKVSGWKLSSTEKHIAFLMLTNSTNRDEWTGRLSFKAYNISPRKPLRNRLIRLLEHGWVKESPERIKVYESIPKHLGTARVMSVLDREVKVAKDALIDREIIDFV